MGRYLSFDVGKGIAMPPDGGIWFDENTGELRDIPVFEVFPDRSQFSNPDEAEFDGDDLDEEFFEFFLPENFPALAVAYSYVEDAWSLPIVVGKSTYIHTAAPYGEIPDELPDLTPEEMAQLKVLCLLLDLPYEPRRCVAISYG